MYLVTGGAGFIGSHVARALAGRGERVAICDWLGMAEKWRNLAKHEIEDFISPDALMRWLGEHAGRLGGIVHMGAISATTETDGDRILEHNFRLSAALWAWCAEQRCPLIYASSAATYGDGSAGFDDRLDRAGLGRLRPLNLYGWSKHVFDRRALRAAAEGAPSPPKWAGLKFFNVYGPNEYHKGAMQSVIAQHYPKLVAGEPLRLFRSENPDYADGGQLRDFVYVEDCVHVILWMLDHEFAPGLYNVGTGRARSWLDLGRAIFRAAGLPERIEFIDMPEALAGRYQYVTEARMEKLRAAGCGVNFRSLEDGVAAYIGGYLSQSDRWM